MSPSRSTSRRRNGMALVITLATVVLLTILVLAFFSRAQLNRQISFSSTNLIKADDLARSSLDVVVGELRDEILDAAHSNVTTAGGLTLYQPITTTDWLPRPSGVAHATGPLLKVSANGVPLRSGGSIAGSSVAISAPSMNGRSLSASRWFTSSTASPRLGSQSALPTWLFMTRGGGVRTPDIGKAKDPADADYVVGRFAYTVYDTGGLFDATVAGCPNNAPFATPATEIGFKSSTSYVDLSLFGLGTAALDKFYSWRNGANGTGQDSATFLEWSAGIRRSSGTPNAAALAVALSGHREIAVGDNTPLTRHDLISNPNLAGATTLALTHFSRSLNAPSYTPSPPTATNPNLANVPFSAPANYLHYHDDGTTEPASFATGEALLQRRFSLAKLAWLTCKGPSSDLPANDALHNAGGTDAAIQSCFGLKWTALLIGGVSTPCWRYVGSVPGAAIPTEIEKLSVVAGESREPNFFELLKAGILSGSLGRSSDLKTLADSTSQMTLEKIGDLQLLRIGACIIDSADADNFPTTITLAVGGLDVPVHGLEDLPYLFGTTSARLNGNTSINPATTVNSQQVNWMSCIMIPILFNPHQVSTPAAGLTPSDIRIRIANGTLNKMAASGAASGSFYTATFRNLTGSPVALTALPSIPVPPRAFENFRAGLKSVNYTDNGNTATELGTLVNQSGYTGGTTTSNGFLLYNYATPFTYDYPSSPPATAEVARGLNMVVSNLLLVLEYQDADGWHIYDTLTGNEAYTTGTGIGPNASILVASSFSPTSTNHSSLSIGYGQFRYDPRTTRFGVSSNGGWSLNASTPLSTGNTANPSTWGGSLPFSPTPSSVYPGDWAEGGKIPWSLTVDNNIADPDGVTRPADAGLINANANLYRNLTDMPRRPVILQRPFRSVAELGQVFRDSPGKTLSFFDNTSGDKALLDLFSVSDEPAIGAGRVQLNTTQTQTQQALFTGAAQASDGTLPLTAPQPLSTAYNTYAFTAGTPSGTMPTSPCNVVDFLSNQQINGSTSLDSIKSHREAVVRALADTTQTRTWNLLIDVVAQSGHYPANAAALDNFIVEGERRYWLSIAIDRLTGKVIDQQLEPASN